MSEFKFSCSQCGQHIRCDALWSGCKLNCPACQQPLVVPCQVPPDQTMAEPPRITRKRAAPVPLTVSRHVEEAGLAEDTGRDTAPAITSTGLVKLDKETTLENFLTGGAIGALIITLGLGWAALVGWDDSPPNPALLPVALGALPFAMVFFGARFFTDNYYLLDWERHRILYHFKFLWFHHVRLVLQRKDIAAVTVQGQRNKKRKYEKHYWEYRVGVVGTNGRWVALTEWQKEALEPCNREAAKLAAMLGCEAYSAFAGCELALRKRNGRVSIAYVPLWHGTTRKERWITLVAALILAGSALYVKLTDVVR